MYLMMLKLLLLWPSLLSAACNYLADGSKAEVRGFRRAGKKREADKLD